MSAASAPAPGLRRDATVISLVGFCHGTSHFFHFVLPTLFPWLMRDFGLTFTEVGATMTVFFIFSGVGQALAGFVVDRFGALRVLHGGIGLLAVAALGMGFAPNFPVLLCAAAISGVGNSVFHPADFTVLNRSVSTQRLGHAFSVHQLSGSLGWAAAPVFVAAVAETLGWRSAAIGAALVGFGALAVLHLNRGQLTEREIPVEARKARGGTFAFLRSGVVWMCFLFFFFAVGAFGALQNFAPPILERTYNVTLTFAASGLTAYLLGNAAGTAAGGFFARGVHQERLVAMALAFAAACAIALASGAVPSWSIVALMGLMGFGSGFTGPSRDILVRRAATSTFGAAAYGRVYGFVYSGIDTGLALAPILFGTLMDAARYSHVLWGVAALQTLAIFTALAVGWRSAPDAAPR